MLENIKTMPANGTIACSRVGYKRKTGSDEEENTKQKLMVFKLSAGV